jgi:hypothetical protein
MGVGEGEDGPANDASLLLIDRGATQEMRIGKHTHQHASSTRITGVDYAVGQIFATTFLSSHGRYSLP